MKKPKMWTKKWSVAAFAVVLEKNNKHHRIQQFKTKPCGTLATARVGCEALSPMLTCGRLTTGLWIVIVNVSLTMAVLVPALAMLMFFHLLQSLQLRLWFVLLVSTTIVNYESCFMFTHISCEGILCRDPVKGSCEGILWGDPVRWS